jgi:hypothetical protein
MSRAQRIVVIVYCLAVAYCCLWVPWHIAQQGDYLRVGYGWLWSGPSNADYGVLPAPDIPIIGLRILAATAIGIAAFCVTYRRR